jgi:FKBP-type peptidyl-prolyl cis-trans isomerase FkpA
MHAKSVATTLTTAWAVLALAGCQPKDKPADSATTAAAPASAAGSAAEPAAESAPADTGTQNMPMQKIDLAPGNGAEIKSGQNALVHYTGWLYDAAAPENKGQKFDSSVDRNEPFEFPVGAGMVIKGWDEGVVGMKVGGKRRLVIPPEMGYGARGAGGVIPPGATLVFDVELVEIR